jgi:hypothetical protein
VFARFHYTHGRQRALGDRDWRSAFPPPSVPEGVFTLDLAREAPNLVPALATEFETLRTAIEGEWNRSRTAGHGPDSPSYDAPRIARIMSRLAGLLPGAADRRALELRANAVAHG